MTDFNSLTSAQLVAEFNTMAASEAGRALEARPVAKFQDRATGVARCERLASSIKAWSEGQAAEKARNETGAPVAKKKEEKKLVGTVDRGGFPLRPGSHRETLVVFMLDNLGKQLSIGQLIEHVYGQDSEELRGSLAMVMVGMKQMIKKFSLPYEVRRERVNKVLTFGLHKTN